MSKIKQTLWAIVCAVLLIGAKGGGCEVASEGGGAVINYAGADDFPATIPTPEGSDLKTAASVSAALQGLADRTAYLRANRGSSLGNFNSGSPLININSGTHTDIASCPIPGSIAYNNGRVEAHAVFNVVIPASYIGAIQPVVKQIGGAGAGAEVELTESIAEFSDGGGQLQTAIPVLVYFDMSDVYLSGPFTVDATSFELVFRGWIPGFVGGPDNFDVNSAKIMCRGETF